MHTTDELRAKIKAAGWLLRERPIRTGGLGSATILSWKLIAIKGDRDITLGGKTIDEAVLTMSRTLGIVR